MCIKEGRPDGTLVCATMTQEIKDEFNSYYEVGYNCMCTGFWKYVSNKGHDLPILGASSHNCAVGSIGDSTNWTLADKLSDLGAGTLSTMCDK